MRKIRQLKTADASGYLSIEEAADTLNIKPTALRNYLCDGKLTTYKFKTLTLVDADEVKIWKERRSKR